MGVDVDDEVARQKQITYNATTAMWMDDLADYMSVEGVDVFRRAKRYAKENDHKRVSLDTGDLAPIGDWYDETIPEVDADQVLEDNQTADELD